MNETLIRFADIPWSKVSPGAREKRLTRGTQDLRLVEFTPPFNEIDWCRKQHIGFVVSGQLTIDFRDSRMRYESGDGIAIPAGDTYEHRAVVDEPVTLFLVEMPELS